MFNKKKSKAAKASRATKKINVDVTRLHLANEYFNDDKIAEEAYELAKWVNRTDSFWLQDFYIERGYTKRVFDLLKKKSALFREVCQYAIDVQEERLVKRGLDTNNPKFIMWILEKYHNKESKETACTFIVNARDIHTYDEKVSDADE